MRRGMRALFASSRLRANQNYRGVSSTNAPLSPSRKTQSEAFGPSSTSRVRLPNPICNLRPLGGCISPAQLVAVDEHDAAHHPKIVHARLTVALETERPKPFRLIIRQSVQVGHSNLLPEPESDRAPHINGA